MKKIATLYILLLCFFANAQESGTIAIEWLEKSNLIIGINKIDVPQFKSDSYNFDNYNKTLKFIKKFKSSATADENSLQITNVVYESLSEKDLGELAKKNIPTTLLKSLSNSFARDIVYVTLSICPIIKNENGYQRVKSFTYSFTNAINSSKNNTITTFSVSNSVLSSGNWYRFYVEKSGVYKLSKSFLESIGVNFNGTDAKKIKIYGNGGRMLPLMNNEYYPNDIEENAITVVGEADGVFNDSDYILFYGEGVDVFNLESDTNVNLYSNKSYYYVTTDGNDGKRIQENNQPAGTASLITTTADQNLFYEVDLNNIVKTGRRWYGEQFGIDNEKEFEFKIPNIVSSLQTNLTVHVGGASYNETSFEIKNNDAVVSTLSLDPLTLDSDTYGTDTYLNTAITSSENIKIKLKFDDGSVPSSKGFLDYIRLRFKGNLAGYGKQFQFYKNDAGSTTGIVEYQVSAADKIIQVWDITDVYNVTKYDNSSSASFSFKAQLGEIRKYQVVNELDYYVPKKEQKTKVVNQNLKGTIFNDAQGVFKDIDYLIITPTFLYSQAEKLANFHRNYSLLNVKVVDLETIYQEFSSGKQDLAAIRNFVKYVYQNASSPSGKLKYVNLFGDASFDFKDRIPNNTNIVPIYHSIYSNTAGESSFATDDFFGLMDDNEGRIETSSTGSPSYGIDIAVGRMIVSTTQQAEEMVNKVLEYHDIKSYGSWRNNYVSISDDPDSYKIGDYTLQIKQNNLTNTIVAQKPFINYKKIFIDAYQQVTSSGGERYPKAREEMLRSFEKGALVFNYLGHGGEDGLTGERIWEKPDGLNFQNQYRYPLFITLTCDFSRFDNPLRPTAGEFTYLNPKGGSIAMITTIRSIGQGTAENFNDVLADKLFSYNSNTYYSIAESLRQAKNDSNNNSSTNVVGLLGDPALMLAIAKPRIILTKVNDVAITQPIDDFKALSYIKLSGEVQDENGQVLTNYNGELSTNIFDKNFDKTTFGNDNAAFSNGVLIPHLTFNNLGETIFRGNASIVNGKFEFGFIVPKDIKIPVGNGKISFYSKRNQTLFDKTGYNYDIKIGGINTNAAVDVTAPKVRLYMNDETFVNGGITNESPYFLAFLDDENGINTASGIGHDLIAILDGDETKPYILNDYYETELDNYKKGKIRFPFRKLAVGLHTITFKAWDVYNNFVTAQIQFLVVGDEDVTLTNVLNYPNPFVNYTQFWFTHNKPFEPLDIQVQIITITGKVVKTINQSVTTEGFLSREISWDGKDDFGDKIGKGVYIYKLTVQSNLTNKKSEKIEKLVIL